MRGVTPLDTFSDVEDQYKEWGLPAPDCEPETLMKFVGYHIREGPRRELRPYHECPHCGSYAYTLQWARGVGPVQSPERSVRNNARWWCDRCELRRPYDEPPEDFGSVGDDD